MIALAIVFTEAPNSANEVRKLRPFSRLGQSKRLRQEIRRGPARSPSASEAGSHSRVTSRNLMALFQSARTRLDGCVWRLAVAVVALWVALLRTKPSRRCVATPCLAVISHLVLQQRVF
jgi:hypothetical protein